MDNREGEKSMIKGIIFDLDGTLLNTAEDLATASNRVMEDYGYPTYTTEEIMYKVGNGNRNLMLRCLPEDKEYQTDEALELFKKHYADCYMEKTRPYEGMPELLEKLSERGVLLAVNTNKLNEYCENLIKKNFPGIHFVKILGNVPGIPRKPDPAGVALILKEMNLSGEEVLYIGDSDVDIRTAGNAGVRSVWVSWGFRKLEDVLSAGPDALIDKPEELLDLI